MCTPQARKTNLAALDCLAITMPPRVSNAMMPSYQNMLDVSAAGALVYKDGNLVPKARHKTSRGQGSPAGPLWQLLQSAVVAPQSGHKVCPYCPTPDSNRKGKQTPQSWLPIAGMSNMDRVPCQLRQQAGGTRWGDRLYPSHSCCMLPSPTNKAACCQRG